MTFRAFYFYWLFSTGLLLNSCIGIESVDLTSRHSDVSVPTNDTDSDREESDDPDSEQLGSDIPDSDSQTADEPSASNAQQDTDMCPDDPDKLEPGICDCGTPDLDSDEDGTMDCMDACPNDENKTEPGICNCGEPDMDSDDDGIMDCEDECPFDNQKTVPGPCGCGVEAFSCWECVQATDCPAAEYGCEEPICIEGQCGTRPVSQGNQCREAIGACDEAEYCDGVHHNCPPETGIKASCIPGEPVTIKSLGRTVTFSNIAINGRDTNIAYVRPKSNVTLEVSGYVVDSDADCGSCMTQYYITLENTFTLCLGNSPDSWVFSVLHTFVAPETPGIYFVQTLDSWQYDCRPDSAGLIPESNLAIIRVE